MPLVNYSLSFAVEADEETMKHLTAQLDKHLAGQIKDLIARSLAGFDFDLRERYWLLSPETEAAGSPRQRTPELPLWSPADEKYLNVRVGSPEWFQLVGNEKKFTYRYGDLSFTVRRETRQSKGKSYTYWRAYVTINGKLVTKQLGPTAALTKAVLDATGDFFLQKKERG